MTRNFTIHVAQHDKTATVWQVLEFGKCVVYFSTLRDQARRDAERWVVANRDTGQVETYPKRKNYERAEGACPIASVNHCGRYGVYHFAPRFALGHAEGN